MARYAKALVAVVGAAVTAALQFWGPETSVGRWLTIFAAGLTALGVYAVRNEPSRTSE